MRFRVVLIALAVVAACSTTDESGGTTTSTSTIPVGGDAPTVVVAEPPTADPAPEPPALEPEPEPEPAPERPEPSDPDPAEYEGCGGFRAPTLVAPEGADFSLADRRCEGVFAYYGVIDETRCPTGHPCPGWSQQIFYAFAEGAWQVVASGDDLSCAAPVNAPMADACAQLGLAG